MLIDLIIGVMVLFQMDIIRIYIIAYKIVSILLLHFSFCHFTKLLKGQKYFCCLNPGLKIDNYSGRDLLIGQSLIDSDPSVHNNSCSEADEIYKICSVIGSPTKDSWADGLALAREINYQFPQVSFTFLDAVHAFYMHVSKQLRILKFSVGRYKKIFAYMCILGSLTSSSALGLAMLARCGKTQLKSLSSCNLDGERHFLL